jgi:hypothetical protein
VIPLPASTVRTSDPKNLRASSVHRPREPQLESRFHCPTTVGLISPPARNTAAPKDFDAPTRDLVDPADPKTLDTSNPDLRPPELRVVGLSDPQHLHSEEHQRLGSSTPVNPDLSARRAETLDTSSLPKTQVSGARPTHGPDLWSPRSHRPSPPRIRRLTTTPARSTSDTAAENHRLRELTEGSDAAHRRPSTSRAPSFRRRGSKEPRHLRPKTFDTSDHWPSASDAARLQPSTPHAPSFRPRGSEEPRHFQPKTFDTSDHRPSASARSPPHPRPEGRWRLGLQTMDAENPGGPRHLRAFFRTFDTADPKAVAAVDPGPSTPPTRRSAAPAPATADPQIDAASAPKNARPRRSEDHRTRPLRGASTPPIREPLAP